MPIGKNSLKRVKNNGYSSVKTEAPDMENSTVTEPEVKKSTGTGAKKKKPSAKPAREPKKAAEESRDGFVRVELGSDMPHYLL